MAAIRFAWDERKNQANIRRHSVSFEEAQTAFYDANARVIGDPDHSSEEDRFILIGISRRPRLLVVCHCYREGQETIRIISARKANKVERRQYVALGGPRR